MSRPVPIVRAPRAQHVHGARRVRRALVTVATLVTVTLMVAVAALSGATTAAAATDEQGDDRAGSSAVVVIGTSGLRWDDVHTLSTPALWDLSRRGAIGTVAARSVRSSACPADGWLALSAGARAADLPGAAYGECRRLSNPDGTQVRGWADYVSSAAQESYDPTLGLLADTVAGAGLSALAVGPGAAIALADASGTVAAYAPRPPDPAGLRGLVRESLADVDLLVVDAGSVRDTGRATVPRPDPTSGAEAPGEPPATGEQPAGPEVIAEPTRAEQVTPIDQRIGAVLAAVDAARRDGREVTVLVVSLADSGTRARMQLAAALGPAPSDGARYADALLGSRSTRQPGMIQATDITPTVLAALGIGDQVPSGSLVGAAVRPVPGPSDANARLETVLGIDAHSAAVRPITPTFYTVLISANLLLYLLVSIGLTDRALGLIGRLAAHVPRGGRLVRAVRERPRAVLRAFQVAGVAVASLPVASFLANLSPWWRASSPGWAIIGLVAGWTLVLGAVALLPRWRHPLLAPMAVVAGATALVIAVDIATGATLQVSAPMGVQPVVAGRFYGFNNTAFSLFAAATILVAAVVADPLVRAGRRRAAAWLVAGIGLAATVLDGMPGLGSDFGGPPALVPGFAVLTLMAAGLRLSWLRLVGVLGAGVLVVTAFAVLDWLRPADQRTHLGRFVETVLDGGLLDVVGRKLAQNLNNLGGTWLTLLALGGIAVVAFVLVRPLRGVTSASDGGPFSWLSSGAPLSSLAVAAPMLRPGLVALAVTLGIGFAVNDSGIVIPALGISVAVPLLVAVSAGWLLGLKPAADVQPSPEASAA